MATSYYQKQLAVSNVGEELARRGWKLYGYHEDQSDSMTDYFHPASWDGVAEHPDYPGVLVLAGVDQWRVKSDSGRKVYETLMVRTHDCEFCGGTGVWPAGLTYQEAKINPRGQHFIEYCAKDGGRPLLMDVVSPLHYFEGGEPICLYCHGRGYFEKPEQGKLLYQWPVFLPLPKGRMWGIQHNGRIVATGTGYDACGHHGYYNHNTHQYEPVQAVLDTCDKIEQAVRATIQTPATNPPASGSAGSVTYTITLDRDWTWVSFPSNPGPSVLDILRNMGARFSKRRLAWYLTRPAQEELEAALAG